MSADHAISLPNAADVARVLQQVHRFRERMTALHADMGAFLNKLPHPDEQWDHPSVVWRKLAHLNCQLDHCVEVLADLIGGYLTPEGDDADLSTRASDAIRQIARIAAGLAVETEEVLAPPSSSADVIYPDAFRR